MRSRTVHLGLGFALGLTLLGGSALGQSHGAIQVLGLRAPDGDDEFANQLSVQLRGAARTAGYEVPDNSPPLEQEIAVVGCATTGPDCLAQIADDVHAQKIVYGTVTRIGRGRNASLNVEVSLWDQSTRREVDREVRTFTAQQRSAQAIQTAASEMMQAIATHDVPVATNPGLTVTQVTVQQPPPDTRDIVAPPPVVTPPPSHALRYVGIGMIGVGVVLGGIGVWQAVASSGQNGDSRDATATTPGEFGAWARFNGEVNANGSLSASDVCDRAQSSTSVNAGDVRSLCSSNDTHKLLGFTLGIGGAVLAGVGAVLIAVDGRGQERPAAPAAHVALDLFSGDLAADERALWLHVLT
ncbi:MAG: hypothetical protein U0325_31655 [Polyangiales bacterium]